MTQDQKQPAGGRGIAWSLLSVRTEVDLVLRVTERLQVNPSEGFYPFR